MRYVFGDSTLDTQLYVLHRGGRSLPLRAKVFQVLHYLLTHRDRVISRQELCEQVWPDQFISEAALEAVIKGVRRAVGDDGRTQWCIQTRRGQGYRFVASVTATWVQTRGEKSSGASPPAVSACRAWPGFSEQPRFLVDRQAELEQIHSWWLQARQGTRQVGFVTGEAGIGKTALIEAFVHGLSLDQPKIWVGRGQCIEHYGPGEAYLPLLEALGRLCRAPDGEYLLALLRQHAPSWLAQMPTLLPFAERDALQRLASGVTPARMLRELAEAVEALTTERPLLLVLEDLHWSDASTLDWLAYVARRHDPARLLVLGTYRSVVTLPQTHPLRTLTPDLWQQGSFHVLPLGYLSPTAVTVYLRHRFGEEILPKHLPRIIHQRTNGNPLFMVSLVDEILAQGGLRESPDGWGLSTSIDVGTVGIPESLRQLIEQQVDRLEPSDQQLLEAASVAGVECSVAAIAAGIGRDVDEVEARCAVMARQHHFLQAHGIAEWPDGTVATRYLFRHALHQEALYERVPPGQRVRIHRLIGDRLEGGYGSHAWEIAAELAVHFARGRDVWRAVRYQYIAGENALRRSAHQEALAHLTQGLGLLTTLPESREHALQELALHVALGRVHVVTKGYAAPEVGTTYVRAHTLAREVGDHFQRFVVLFGLWQFHILRAEFKEAYALARQLLHLAHDQEDAILPLQAHRALAYTLLCRGDVIRAHRHAEAGVARYDPARHGQHAFQYGQDARITCLLYAAHALWVLGYPAQALDTNTTAMTLAQELRHPYSIACALGWAAWLHQHRREWWAVQERAEALVALAMEQGFTLWAVQGTIMQGWASVMGGREAEGMTLLRQGMAALERTGTALMRPYFLALLAEACGRMGQSEQAWLLITEARALARRHGERFCEAELYRLLGEMLLQKDRSGEQQAETHFHHALAMARRHQAKSWELRASISLGRLRRRQGQHLAARQILVTVYDRFTEGFDTLDLREARELLDELSCGEPSPPCRSLQRERRPYANR